MEEKQKDVFISYRREDNNGSAREIAKALEKRGFSVFYDKSDIHPGMQFPDVIKHALDTSHDFLIIVSKSYFGYGEDGNVRILNNGDWCQKELLTAIKGHKHIIPIVLDKNYFKLPLECKSNDEELKKSINSVFKINYLEYSITENEDIFFDKLVEYLSPESISNSRMNYYSSELIRIVNERNISKINIQIRKLILTLTEDDIVQYFYPILDGKWPKSVCFYSYYAIFTYYRRLNYHSKIRALVDKYGALFNSTEFPFNNVILSQYYLYLFDEDSSSYINLDQSIKYADMALDSIPNNSGVYVTYAHIIVNAAKSNITRYKQYVPKAISCIKKAMTLNINYPKHYYILGMLEGINKNFNEGIRSIKHAIDLENSESKDAFLRIAVYYEAINEIKLKQLENKLLERFNDLSVEKHFIVADKLIYFPNNSWGEDRYFIGSNFWGVIDGATPIDKVSKEGFISQAEWFAHSLKTYLEQLDSIEDFPQRCDDFIHSIKEDKYLYAIKDKYNQPSATIAAVTIQNGFLWGYILGDCEITILNRKGECLSFTDDRINKFSQLTVAEKQNAIKNNSDVEKAVRKQRIINRNVMNTEAGYWTVSPQGYFVDRFVRFTIPLDEIDKCFIYSDGLKQACSLFNINFINLLYSKQPSKFLIEKLTKEKLAEDAQINKYVKTLDDISFILLKNCK